MNKINWLHFFLYVIGVATVMVAGHAYESKQLFLGMWLAWTLWCCFSIPIVENDDEHSS